MLAPHFLQSPDASTCMRAPLRNSSRASQAMQAQSGGQNDRGGSVRGGGNPVAVLAALLGFVHQAVGDMQHRIDAAGLRMRQHADADAGAERKLRLLVDAD